MVKNIKSIRGKLKSGFNYNIIIKNMKKTNFVLFVIFFIILVIAIGFFTWNYFASQEEPSLPPSPTGNKTSLANPASVFCEEQGGQIDFL